VFASTNVREFTKRTTFWGSVCALDKKRVNFIYQSCDGREFKTAIPEQHRESILDAFDGYDDGARVFIKGIGKFSNDGRLKSLEAIEHVAALETLDIQARLNELSYLKSGWLEGKGVAPSKEGLFWLAKSFEHYFPEGLPLPYLYPTEEGGIRAEWSLELREVSLDIALNTHKAVWHYLKIDSGEDETKEINLENEGDWNWLIEQVRSMNGGEA
jgi:hypothetical protein